jgi:hypothetical protein
VAAAGAADAGAGSAAPTKLQRQHAGERLAKAVVYAMHGVEVGGALSLFELHKVGPRQSVPCCSYLIRTLHF